MMRAWFFVSLLLCALLRLGDAAAAEPSFPALTGRVVDQAHLLSDSARTALESKLADFEAKTGRQVVVATLDSLQGYEIEDYGYRLGRYWGIGQKGSNNGALLIIAPKERRARIEVGYGLEGTLTDAVSRLILENAVLPRFRANDFQGGIERGVDDILQVLSGDAESFKQRAAQRTGAPATAEDAQQLIWIALIFGLWFFWMLRSRGRRRRRSAWPWIVPTGGWGSGGWGGSGSGGGFSGGGGSFGGGGASGRW